MTTMSQTAAQAILARETAEVFCDCMTISGPGLETRRYVNDTQELVRAGGTYTPASFRGNAPDDTYTMAPGMQIVVDNVDREAVRLIKTYPGIPTVVFETVMRSEPDNVVHGPFSFTIKQAKANMLVVELGLGYQENFLGQAVPKDTYGPTNSPGMY